MMNKEIVFAQTLEQVKKTAREQGGCISEQQVEEAFSPLDLGEEQLQMVFDYLKKHKIGIGEPLDDDEYLSEEERNYLQDYLDEIASLKSVSEGEKEAITLSAMAGDLSAQSRLVELYLSDVVEIAKLYAGQGVLLEDLVGEGNLALAAGASMLGCLEHAGEAQGMLGKMIMDAMEEYIAENVSNGKTGQRVADKVNAVSDKAKELAEDLGRKVTPQELSQETGMSLRMIMDAVRMSGFNIEYIEARKEV